MCCVCLYVCLYIMTWCWEKERGLCALCLYLYGMLVPFTIITYFQLTNDSFPHTSSSWIDTSCVYEEKEWSMESGGYKRSIGACETFRRECTSSSWTNFVSLLYHVKHMVCLLVGLSHWPHSHSNCTFYIIRQYTNKWYLFLTSGTRLHHFFEMMRESTQVEPKEKGDCYRSLPFYLTLFC